MTLSTAEFAPGLPGISYEEDNEGYLKNPRDLISISDSYFNYAILSKPEVENEILLGFLQNPLLNVIEPFKTKISKENGKMITDIPELEAYGVGDSLSESIIDLQLTIEELYFSLAEDPNALGPHLKNIFDILKTKISNQ